MPCDLNATPLKQNELNAALDRLEQYLRTGVVSVRISPTGALAFVGWEKSERGGLSDICSYRRLMAKGSFALRQAISAAEVRSGQKLNPAAIAAGVHSHDGGLTWSTH